MNRRDLLRAAALALVPASTLAAAAKKSRTRWIVRGSEGFDAIAFMAPLSGDPFYTRYYEKEVAQFEPRMPRDAMAALRKLKAEVAATDGLLSPSFDLALSGGPDDTLGDILHSLDNAERILRPPLRASPYWEDDGDESWRRFMSRVPVVRSILVAMRDAGFPEFRAAIFDPKASTRLSQARERLAAVDVISEAERFTGRPFDPEIEVVLLEFSNPHGIKVIGQKFLTGIGYDDKITIQTAAHEILHPPVNMRGPAAKAALAVLNEDALLRRIVAEHDPAFGYSTMAGILDEDLVKALDQVISERLGVANDPAERWTEQDDGMHVLAAGFYGLMQETGFAKTGGNLEHWLLRQAKDGSLRPPKLHDVAAKVLKRAPDRLWPVK